MNRPDLGWTNTDIVRITEGFQEEWCYRCGERFKELDERAEVVPDGYGWTKDDADKRAMNGSGDTDPDDGPFHAVVHVACMQEGDRLA